jgi:c-di-GMP-binding flagellar brake protein YcgR
VCSVPLTLRHLIPGGISTSRGISLDLSQGGLAAVVQDPLRIGETVEIDMKLSSGPFTAVAIVRHTSLSRSGFEFVGLTPEERHMIATHNPRLDG